MRKQVRFHGNTVFAQGRTKYERIFDDDTHVICGMHQETWRRVGRYIVLRRVRAIGAVIDIMA